MNELLFCENCQREANHSCIKEFGLEMCTCSLCSISFTKFLDYVRFTQQISILKQLGGADAVHEFLVDHGLLPGEYMEANITKLCE